jgi:effector-binding domain-containing protein
MNPEIREIPFEKRLYGRSRPVLENQKPVIPRYIYYRHVGPYDLLGQAYSSVNAEIASKVLATTGLSLEIYGHWSKDPAKLVVELLIGLK